MLKTSIWGWYCHYLDILDEETEAQSDLWFAQNLAGKGVGWNLYLSDPELYALRY